MGFSGALFQECYLPRCAQAHVRAGDGPLSCKLPTPWRCAPEKSDATYPGGGSLTGMAQQQRSLAPYLESFAGMPTITHCRSAGLTILISTKAIAVCKSPIVSNELPNWLAKADLFNHVHQLTPMMSFPTGPLQRRLQRNHTESFRKEEFVPMLGSVEKSKDLLRGGFSWLHGPYEKRQGNTKSIREFIPPYTSRHVMRSHLYADSRLLNPQPQICTQRG